MQFLYGIIFASVLGTATASKIHGTEEAHPVFKRSSCETRNVFFHFNDSSIGVTSSCSWNVINLAALSISRDGLPSPLSTRQSHGCIGGCIDGPVMNYTVVSGDTIEKIAASLDSGVCDIFAANEIENANYIVAGQVLLVPTDLCDPDNDSCVTPPGSRPCVPIEECVDPSHEIVTGDTFFILGQQYNVTADALRAANPCLDPGSLEPGQKIHIPICPDCETTRNE